MESEKDRKSELKRMKERERERDREKEIECVCGRRNKEEGKSYKE